MRKPAAACLSVGAVVAATLAGQRHGPQHPRTALWYASLRKPSYTPPGPVIGAAWTALDALLCVAGYKLLTTPPSPNSQRRAGSVGPEHRRDRWLPLGLLRPQGARREHGRGRRDAGFGRRCHRNGGVRGPDRRGRRGSPRRLARVRDPAERGDLAAQLMSGPVRERRCAPLTTQQDAAQARAQRPAARSRRAASEAGPGAAPSSARDRP